MTDQPNQCGAGEMARVVVAQAGVVNKAGVKYTAEALRRMAALQSGHLHYDEESGTLSAEAGVEMFPIGDEEEQWQAIQQIITEVVGND